MSGYPSSPKAPTGIENSRPVLLFVLHRYPDGGGISSILENYLAELDGQFEVHVAIVEPGPAAQFNLALDPDRISTLGYSNFINPALMPTSLVYTARVAAFLKRIVRRISPRVVVTQDALYLPVPALLACRNTDARVVVMDHGTLTNVHETTWLPMVTERLGKVNGLLFKAGFHADRPWREARWRLGVRYADEVWFTGEELRPWFERAGSRAKEYSQSVPMDYRPATPEERAAARQDLGLGAEVKVFNSVGRLDGEKGLDTLIEVAAMNEESPVDWHLLIAGDGTLSSWLSEEVRRRGLERRITFTGRLGRPDLLRLQHASDFHVYAGTISCGVSICLLEAMASGVVPIVSDVPQAQVELVGDSGWVFPSGDVEAFSSAFDAALALTDDELSALRTRVLDQIGSGQRPSVPALLDDLLTHHDNLTRL
jgi:glycosyltransferase involved in cell wall biosynthesis